MKHFQIHLRTALGLAALATALSGCGKNNDTPSTPTVQPGSGGPPAALTDAVKQGGTVSRTAVTAGPDLQIEGDPVRSTRRDNGVIGRGIEADYVHRSAPR